jgi:tetratricopeptide (TPR) repeat protein
MQLNDIQIMRMLDQARSLIEEEKYLHAMQVYRRLLSASPDFLEGYFELSGLFTELGELTAALTLLEKAYALFPDNADLMLQMGDLNFRTGSFDGALTWYRRLLGLRLPVVHYKMGIAYFAKGNLPLAEEQFGIALKLDPAFPKLYESLGELLLEKGEYTQASEMLRKGIHQDPYRSHAHFLLGEAYNRLLQWHRAYDEFVIATDMDPENAAYWQKCGEALFQLERYREAEPYLRKSLELAPRCGDVLIDLAEVLLKQGDRQGAGKYFKEALLVDPGNIRGRDSHRRFLRDRQSKAQ